MDRRVLIIDDDQQMCQELSDLFRSKRISVMTAESGRISLKIAQQDPYDVALVDVRLPDCDGIELIAQLRKKRPESAYILITAYASLESAIKTVRYGALEYIPKPFEIKDVIQAIERGFALKDEVVSAADHHKKIADANRDLEKKLDGLRRLNDIYLGREREIADLKREVNSLMKAMNQDIKYEDC